MLVIIIIIFTKNSIKKNILFIIFSKSVNKYLIFYFYDYYLNYNKKI